MGILLGNIIGLLILIGSLYLNEALKLLSLAVIAWVGAAFVAGVVGGQTHGGRARAGLLANAALLLLIAMSLGAIRSGTVLAPPPATLIFVALLPLVVVFGIAGSRLGGRRPTRMRAVFRWPGGVAKDGDRTVRKIA